jgi:alanine dehydrogenase
MIVGVPKEIKAQEYRVGMVPSGVVELIARGHSVLVEHDAGVATGISNEEYIAAGAQIVDVETVFAKADMIVKVKEPQPEECQRLRENQILFTYLHLAPDPEQARAILDRKIVGVAYETVELSDHSLPLLTPMSEVAGRMAIQVAARCLEKENGGRGILLSGVPGVERAKVAIIGGGVVGTHAAKIAVGIGARVTVLDTNLRRLVYLDDIFGTSLNTIKSNTANIHECVAQSDVVIGAVLHAGGRAPHLVTRDMLKDMREGSVIVDVAVDQGGCIETTRPTTHQNPTYEVEGVIHYCVANIPGAVPRTSTFALTNATMPYVCQLADCGCSSALLEHPALAKGVNVFKGKVTCKPVAEALDLFYHPLEELI